MTGAADRLPERVRMLVYLDALVPRDGQSGLELLPGWFGDLIRGAAGREEHGWVAVPDDVPASRGTRPPR